MSKPNNTKYAVLGALALEGCSGYDLKKFLSNSIGHFWKISYGQVYPLLKQLAAEGLATVKTETQKKRPSRNVYTITDEGMKELRLWLESPLEMTHTDLPKEMLLRIFFGAFTSIDVTVRHLEQFKQWAQRGRTMYIGIEQHLNEEHAGHSHQPYWLSTLRMGMLNTDALLRWCDESLADLRKHETS
ncbi:MAG: PadR family transcriptional regulator [Candidatus Marinimicrobia bacterium]|nr:PadR family transcriptional regulator [Candidatus Neomarinimicrobiota bacterium]